MGTNPGFVRDFLRTERVRDGFPYLDSALSLVCVLAILSVLIASASAHSVPFSFLDLQLTSHGLEASVVIHDFDLAHDLGISDSSRFLNRVFLSEHSESIHSLLTSRLQISADGITLKPEWDVPQVLRDRESVRF